MRGAPGSGYPASRGVEVKTVTQQKQSVRYGENPADFHSHILPGMDDGSQSVEMSVAMLEETARQGISTIVATPHFYPERESPDSFLARRDRAVTQLLRGGYDRACHPRVCVGAEVAYFPGIGRCQDLKRLCILGTKVVLIEMPFRSWTDTMVEDIISVRSSLGLMPTLAHIDRYGAFRSHATLNKLIDNGVILQINASVYESVLSRSRGIHMLMSGQVQLLGSDCHNVTNRPQRLGTALEAIRKKSDRSLLPQMREFSHFLLREARSLVDM